NIEAAKQGGGVVIPEGPNIKGQLVEALELFRYGWYYNKTTNRGHYHSLKTPHPRGRGCESVYDSTEIGNIGHDTLVVEIIVTRASRPPRQRKCPIRNLRARRTVSRNRFCARHAETRSHAPLPRRARRPRYAPLRLLGGFLHCPHL